MRKKIILFHSDFSLAKTGFGRAMKAILSYLYKTGKYEIHHVSCGIADNSPELSITPWKSYGSIPSDQSKIQSVANDPDLSRSAAYGSLMIDEHIKQIKPDIYIAAQDFWGVDFSIDKNWFNKITSCIWTTLDSLPILPSAVKKAGDIKNYWVWSNFAEKALHKLGHNHVKTVHGPIDSSHFFKLSDSDRKQLRIKNNIPEDSKIIGFVFRNQLRKLVPNLIEGYKLWKSRHPEFKNTYLLLHTSFSEGWNIKSQAEQHGVDTKEILTTYICTKCGEYEVKSFDDRENKFQIDTFGNPLLDKNGFKIETPLNPEGKNCKYCSSIGSQRTTSVGFGITEVQLNEIYNLMDVYAHPFTSGGQEIPIQEAKMTELVTLVTNYSCGEECCEKDAYSLPLEWNKYLEHGTEFIKASTKPESIAEQLDIFFSMSKNQRNEWGKLARKWSIDNFSTEKIGEKIESFIDSSPFIDRDNLENFEASKPTKSNPDASIDSTLTDIPWVKELYKKILNRDLDETDDGFLYWIKELSKQTPRIQIENYFRSVAQRDIESSNIVKNTSSIDDVLEKNGKKRLLYVIPRSIGDCFLSTAVIASLRKHYEPEIWDIYVASDPKYKEIFDGNNNITKWLPYSPEMEDHMKMEGIGDHSGWFDICFTPHISTQRTMNYIHNGVNKLIL